MQNIEIVFKNRTKKIDKAIVKKGNIIIELKGDKARELAAKSVDERFSLDKFIESMFSNM